MDEFAEEEDCRGWGLIGEVKDVTKTGNIRKSLTGKRVKRIDR